MTEDEILEMEAGKELDRIIGKAFGLPIYRNPQYSTFISAAWSLAKSVGLAVFPLNNGDWACCKASHLYHLKINQDHYADPKLVICKQAPEAICKAALLAKLDEIKTGGGK